MRIPYSILVVGLFTICTLFGQFVVGTAALGLGDTIAISNGFVLWSIGSLAAAGGLVVAIRRSYFFVALGLCTVPFGLALYAAASVMRFGR